jgi:hypothetical protein
MWIILRLCGLYTGGTGGTSLMFMLAYWRCTAYVCVAGFSDELDWLSEILFVVIQPHFTDKKTQK